MFFHGPSPQMSHISCCNSSGAGWFSTSSTTCSAATAGATTDAELDSEAVQVRNCWILSTGTRKKSCFQCVLKPVNEGRTRDRSLKIICKKRGAFCVGRPERRSTASASCSQAPNNAASSSLVCPQQAAKKHEATLTCARSARRQQWKAARAV